MLGDRHSDTLITLSDMAIVSAHRGDQQRAGRICREAMRIEQEAQGVEHPPTVNLRHQTSVFRL